MNMYILVYRLCISHQLRTGADTLTLFNIWYMQTAMGSTFHIFDKTIITVHSLTCICIARWHGRNAQQHFSRDGLFARLLRSAIICCRRNGSIHHIYCWMTEVRFLFSFLFIFYFERLHYTLAWWNIGLQLVNCSRRRLYF